VEYKDYYQTLGLDRGATADDIKKAYRKMVRKYHPDVSKHKDADAKTKEINEAYDVLGDAEKRAAYDALGRATMPASSSSRRRTGASSSISAAPAPTTFFADLFAQAGRGVGNGHGGGFQMRGDDIHAAITIDLRDAYQGATRTISLRVPKPAGAGPRHDAGKTLSVNIPRGVTPGQQLRLAGQGHEGHGGAGPGDLYLEIGFAPDPRYRVEGRTCTRTCRSRRGKRRWAASVAVPTPSGTVEVTIPAGSQSGRKLRLKGKGIPANRAGRPVPDPGRGAAAGQQRQGARDPVPGDGARPGFQSTDCLRRRRRCLAIRP
jgi:curved DNA-binding protein